MTFANLVKCSKYQTIHNGVGWIVLNQVDLPFSYVGLVVKLFSSRFLKIQIALQYIHYHRVSITIKFIIIWTFAPDLFVLVKQWTHTHEQFWEELELMDKPLWIRMTTKGRMRTMWSLSTEWHYVFVPYLILSHLAHTFMHIIEAEYNPWTKVQFYLVQTW